MGNPVTEKVVTVPQVQRVEVPVERLVEKVVKVCQSPVRFKSVQRKS